MASRAYATGKSGSFSARATISLHFCRATHVSGADAGFTNDDGWIGTGSFRPFRKFGSVIGFDEWGIQFDFFAGFGAYILTGINDDRWATDVVLGDLGTPIPPSFPAFPSGAGLLKEWIEDETPDTVSIDVACTFGAAEWAVETDSLSGLALAGAIRPVSAYDSGLDLWWAVTSDLIVSCSGAASGSRSFPPSVYPVNPDIGLPAIQAKGYFSGAVTAWWGAAFAPGSSTLGGIPAANTEGSLPFPAKYASLDGYSSSVSKELFSGRRVGDNPPSDDAISVGSLGSYGFTAHAAGGGYEYLDGTPSWNVPIAGAVRDWNGPIYNVPIAFPGGTVQKFTGKATIDDLPQPTIQPPAAYSSRDTNCALIRYGIDWPGLKIDRAKQLLAEDFSRVGGTFGWTGTHLSAGPSYTGASPTGVLAATGAATGAPTLTKNLNNDFTVMLTNQATIGTWWIANALGLPQAIQDWWAATGDTVASPHAGEWWKIGRALFPTSDHWNWSPWRYANVQAWADVACAATLTIGWVDVQIAQVGFTATITETPRTASWPLALTAVPGSIVEIDLASHAGHGGLRCITQLSITFPNNRIVSFEGITLFEKSRPRIDVHQPTNDAAFIGVLADGKQALFANSQIPASNALSVWGWPCLRMMGVSSGGSPAPRLQSSTLAELATEIDLQEGYTATVPGGPDHGTPDCATFLRELFSAELPQTLHAQRAFGAVATYPDYASHAPALSLEVNLGNAVQAIVFDPTTFVPVKVPVEADDIHGAIRAKGSCDAIGHAQLALTDELDYTIYAAKGTASQSSVGIQPVSRTWGLPPLTGSETGTGSGPVVLDVTRTGDRYVVFVPSSGPNANVVTIARELGAAAAWEYWPIVVGQNAWMEVDETDPNALVVVAFQLPSTSEILAARSYANGTGGWRAQLASISGENPFLRIDKATGLAYLTYWRSNNVYLIRSRDFFSTNLESEITVATGVPRAAFPFDFAQDPIRTFRMPYSDGTNVHLASSVDNGLTWTLAATSILGQNPFLRVDPSQGLEYLTYTRTGNVYFLRSRDSFATTLESETLVMAAAAGTYTFDFAEDAIRTFLMPYSNGTDVLTIASTDNGLTWH